MDLRLTSSPPILVSGIISLFSFLIFDQVAFAQTQLGEDIIGYNDRDNFGWSVSVSADGNRVAIGGSDNDTQGPSSGHVLVFDWVQGSWVQTGIEIPGDNEGDEAGFSVSLSADGTCLAVGAGQVRVFSLIDGNWSQIGDDIIGEAEDELGASVSLSADGSRLVAGGIHFVSGGSARSAGLIQIFDLIGRSWTQVGQDIYGERRGDRFGKTVSISNDGNRVAVGAPDNGETGSFAGHARVFELASGSWTQLGQDIDGEAAFDLSGWSVSLSADGSRLAVGEPFNNASGESSGQVRIYDLDGGTWIQMEEGIEGDTAHDLFGYSVSLSDDGNRVIGGAVTNAVGKVGYVKIHDWVNGAWTQKGGNLEGIDGEFGFSNSLSADGSLLAVGVPIGGIPTGHDPGLVKVFDLSTIVSNEVLDNLEVANFRMQAYPDPFQLKTKIELRVANEEEVDVTLYDGLGRQVQVVHQGRLTPRTVHSFEVSGTGLPNGLYVIHARGESFSKSRTILRSN